MKKKILIGGCSFSQTMMNLNGFPWKPWTDFLNDEYGKNNEIINKSKKSFGQGKIVESLLDELIKNKFKIDYVIIQWSAIGRSYAIDEKSFFNNILNNDDDLSFSPHIHEYLVNGSRDGWVTDLVNQISNSFYKTSLNQIFLMKSVLEQKNISYKMFWGWEQIPPRIEHESKELLDLIYDENFWRFGKHGGMSECIIDGIGKKEGIIENDLHPTTKGQEFFYNTIIKDIIKEVLDKTPLI